MQVVHREAPRAVGEAMLLLPVKCGVCACLVCMHACLLVVVCCFLACLESSATRVVDILVLRTSDS